MNGNELLRVVDAIHRDKNIDKEIVFDGIEQAILSAARKHFGEENDVAVQIDRNNGNVAVRNNGADLDADEIGDLLGRVAAQTAKQVMIQKIREAERDALYDEYDELKSTIVTGSVTRMEGGNAIVNLGKVEGFMPRGEQVPGETHRVGERVRAVVLDVRKKGSRVQIVLSRTHPDFVRRLFELEIPEVSEHVIEVRSLSREAGYRSKVAVSCYDSKIDAVGACVGVRGSRIKSIVDELAGERIDIVRWNDSLQVLVPNALQPAEVEDVILCPMLGKVIVLVREDQLSLAIGKKGQNVRLASKLVGWDINVMTQERLDEQLEKSVAAFASIPNVTDELAENLVSQGFFTYEDLSVIEPDQLAELGGLTDDQVEEIIARAEREAERVEREEEIQRTLEFQRRRAIERGEIPAEPAPTAPAAVAATTVTEVAAADEEPAADDESAEQGDGRAAATVSGVAGEDESATAEEGEPPVQADSAGTLADVAAMDHAESTNGEDGSEVDGADVGEAAEEPAAGEAR